MTTPKVTARWEIRLDCDCPSCHLDVDLLDAVDFWDGRNLEMGEHMTERANNQEVVCPSCGHEFVIECEY